MEADVARDVALTTADNPFDPLDQYDEWLAYDLAQGYNTNASLIGSESSCEV